MVRGPARQPRVKLAEASWLKPVMLAHLPKLLVETPRFTRRLGKLPEKIRAAILAAELAGRIVYKGGFEADMAGMVREFVKREF